MTPVEWILAALLLLVLLTMAGTIGRVEDTLARIERNQERRAGAERTAAMFPDDNVVHLPERGDGS